jgi:hypothetical protein
MLTLVDAVLMDAPQVVDALVDVAIVVVLAGAGRGNEPEEHVLYLQLEDSYTSTFQQFSI